MRVLLVRHAESAVDPSTDPHSWGLTVAGREAAAALRLDGVSRLFAGPEPKLVETLQPHGPVEIDARFAESRSAGWLGTEEFAAVIERYFTTPDAAPAPGWEPAAEVVARFVPGFVDGAAIASGGRAISAVVSSLTGCDGLTLWRSLRMPHVLVLDQDEQDRWVASRQ